MFRSVKVTVAAGLIAALLTGVGYAATRTVPENQPVTVQNTLGKDLPGDAQALEQALKAKSPVTYKVLVIDGTEGEDRTAYLDRVAEQWGEPKAATLLLVLYADNNWDIRFYMGANFRAAGVTVDEMLSLVRTEYLPKGRVGNPAGGLADLIAAVNKRMGAEATAAYVPPVITVADPFGDGPRQTAAGQLEIIKSVLTQYLTPYKAADRPVAERLAEFKINENKLNPIEADLNRIKYHVAFDVLPADKSGTYWVAGSGLLSNDGWMLDKVLFVTVVKDGNVWKVESISHTP